MSDLVVNKGFMTPLQGQLHLQQTPEHYLSLLPLFDQAIAGAKSGKEMALVQEEFEQQLAHIQWLDITQPDQKNTAFLKVIDQFAKRFDALESKKGTIAAPQLQGMPNSGNDCYLISGLQGIFSLEEVLHKCNQNLFAPGYERLGALLKRVLESPSQQTLRDLRQEMFRLRLLPEILRTGELNRQQDADLVLTAAAKVFDLQPVIDRQGDPSPFLDLPYSRTRKVPLQNLLDRVQVLHDQKPNMLFLRYPRFEYIGGQPHRNLTKITFDPANPIVDLSHLEDANKGTVLYRVKAVITQRGVSPAGGHWVTSGLRGGEWHHFNDSRVTRHTQEMLSDMQEGSYYLLERI